MTSQPASRRRFNQTLRGAAAVLTAGLLLAACASQGSPSTPAGPSGGTIRNGIVGPQTEGTPVQGGTLSFASYASATSLDPAKTPAQGTIGGTEMAALYDLLMRYDITQDRYVPQLAQSLEPSSDARSWTLQLRPGVTFSDGTPLDAAAVVASINRYNTSRGFNSQLWTQNITRTEATGPTSVVFTLNKAWSEFPAMLASGHGMIVGSGSGQGGAFKPIGVGPFTLERFAPHEELLLNARPDYWDGKPNLAKLRFVEITGDQAKLDSLKAKNIQMAFLRAADVVTAARDAGFSGYMDTSPLGSIVLLNNRPGRPGSDVRVRQAIAAAVNVNSFDQRVIGGKGLPGSEIFPDWSKWHSDVAPRGYDPAKARELLDAAKRDGYDGKLRFVGIAAHESQQTALALQAMLQAVGFTVTIDLKNSVADVTKTLNIDHDYDISKSSITLPQGAVVNKLNAALRSNSTSNYSGYQNPDMDALLDRMQAAGDDEAALRPLMADLQRLANETTPFVVLGALASFLPWQANVHGVVPSTDDVMLFGKAWMDRT